MYLVIKNCMNNRPTKAGDKYHLFVNEDAAIEYAESIGWENPFGLTPRWKPGIYNAYSCGDIDVAILFLEANIGVGASVREARAREIDLKMEQEALARARKYDSRVMLHHAGEAGDIVWALAIEEDVSYWVNSFETKKEAVAYAKKHKLKITDKYCTASGCSYHRNNKGVWG